MFDAKAVNRPVLSFFNNKGGVGKTTLVYHLSWMFSLLGLRVLVVDLDPQANLTAAFIDDEQLAEIWRKEPSNGSRFRFQSDAANARISSVFDAVKPILDVGDFAPADYFMASPTLALIPGDLALSGFEDALSDAWRDSNNDKNLTRPFRLMTAFWRLAQESAERHRADLILFDVGPNLGALNRSALLASSHVVVPLGGDLFSLQGLRNLGPTLIEWRTGWNRRLKNWADPEFDIPDGAMQPIGYVSMRHTVRLARPVQAVNRWLNQMPAAFNTSVLKQASADDLTVQNDPNCLALLKNYSSLVSLAQEARKPMFALKVSDGALGAHFNAARSSGDDFKLLAEKIAQRMGIQMPS
jgi:chromosome partitioning protein